MRYLKTIILVVLIVGVLVFAFLIYRNQKPAGTDLITSNTNSTNTTNQTDSSNNQKPTSFVYLQPTLSKITIEDLNKLIARAGSNPIGLALQEYSNGINKVAVNSPILDVSNCVATPNVLRTKLNEQFEVENKDEAAHVLNNGSTFLSVPGHARTKLTMNTKSPGIYAFTCDRSAKFVGVFLFVD